MISICSVHILTTQRAQYLNAIWEVINFEEAERRFVSKNAGLYGAVVQLDCPYVHLTLSRSYGKAQCQRESICTSDSKKCMKNNVQKRMSEPKVISHRIV